MSDGNIRIEYGARRSGNGWNPFVLVNGRPRSVSWLRPDKKSLALEAARITAEEEASSYIGDWRVSVEAAGPS